MITIAAAFGLGIILGIFMVLLTVALYLRRQKAQALRPPESLSLDYSLYHTRPQEKTE